MNLMKTALSSDKAEVEFFATLRTELKRAEKFYATEIKSLVVRTERLQFAISCIEAKDEDVAQWSLCLKSCAQIFKDALDLKNFVLTQVCGFSKIVKKHDKVTGYDTRTAFMCNILGMYNFVEHTQLDQLIEDVKAAYDKVHDIQR